MREHDDPLTEPIVGIRDPFREDAGPGPEPELRIDGEAYLRVLLRRARELDAAAREAWARCQRVSERLRRHATDADP